MNISCRGDEMTIKHIYRPPLSGMYAAYDHRGAVCGYVSKRTVWDALGWSGLRRGKMTYSSEISCADCRYDSREVLCTHPDESKPWFWDDTEAVEGRPWCYKSEAADGGEGE